jgi:hypothetical protein
MTLPPPSSNPSDDAVAMCLVSCRHMSFSIFFPRHFAPDGFNAPRSCESPVRKSRSNTQHVHTRKIPFTGTRVQDPTGLPTYTQQTNFACFSSTRADHTHYTRAACLEALLRQTATWQRGSDNKNKGKKRVVIPSCELTTASTLRFTCPYPPPEPHYNLTVCYQLRLLRDTGSKTQHTHSYVESVAARLEPTNGSSCLDPLKISNAHRTKSS